MWLFHKQTAPFVASGHHGHHGHHVLSFGPPLARYDAVAFRDAGEMGAVQSCWFFIDRAKKTLDFQEFLLEFLLQFDVLNDLDISWHILIQHRCSVDFSVWARPEMKEMQGKIMKNLVQQCNLWVFTFQHSKCTREQVVAERLRIYKTWANGKSAPSVFNELAFRQSEPTWWL